MAVTAPNATQEAERNWQRYEYAKRRGHRSYMANAVRCEQFYLGAGRQWYQEDRQALKETGDRPAYEINEVLPRINAAVGYQIHNRMDISYLPRGGMADTDRAKIRSKVAMQICDQTKYHWQETQVFTDGLIEQRGYFDIRMNFDKNVFGEVDIGTLDPLDVVPDPDAKSYDPRHWFDVTVTRWLTLDDIEGQYGLDKRRLVENSIDVEADWGDTGDDDEERPKFGNEGVSIPTWDSFIDDVGVRKYRVLDRQRWKYEKRAVAIYPTGDVKDLGDAAPEQIAEYAAQGAIMSKRMTRVVQWTVTTRFVTLHDDISPYDRFTVIPYFCFFRRGQTLGLVDNAMSPQEVLNKAVSQFIHILNTSANSGWIVEQNSLVNMTEADLTDQGSKTGLVLIFKQGSTPPVKIKANDVPQGVDRLITHALEAIKSTTVPDAMLGADNEPMSGVALQSKQFVAQNQLAIPLDNLARTRHMVAEFIDYLMTRFMDNHRIFRITETDPMTGREVDTKYEVNAFDPVTRMWMNDLTEGDYDVVVSEQPMQVTFENSQFQQAVDLRKIGVNIPDNVIVKHSNLAEKADVIEQMGAQGPAKLSPLDEAKAALTRAQENLAKAQADKVQAETAETRITSQFGAVQAAQVIAQAPAVAPLADALAKSAGVVDQDAAPQIPSPAVPINPGVPIPSNTSPMFPARPAQPEAGINTGIEGGGQP